MSSFLCISHVSKSSYFDFRKDPIGFQVGDWVRVEFDWAGFKGQELAGEVIRVGTKFDSGVYNLNLQIPADAAVRPNEIVTVPAEYCKFLGFPVAVDDPIDEFINQAVRECYVTEVKSTRFRLEWEMPRRGLQGGWRSGDRVKGYTQLFYPCGHMRQAPAIPETGDMDAFIRSRTGFESLEDLVCAKGGYVPTIHIHEEPRMLILADAYDQAQSKRGDPRRAFRSGEMGDHLTRKHTAFNSFQDLLNHQPTLKVSASKEALTLANLYDNAQQGRGDNRRADRY